MKTMVFLAIVVIVILICICILNIPDDAEDSFVEQEEKLERQQDKDK